MDKLLSFISSLIYSLHTEISDRQRNSLQVLSHLPVGCLHVKSLFDADVNCIYEDI